MGLEWLDRSDWSRRSPQFGALVKHGADVQMEYTPALPERLWRAWLDLGPQSNIMQADRIGILRYAALDWTHGRLEITDPTTLSRFASWGLVLARAYQHLVDHTTGELAWFTRPLVKFDVEGVMRIGFLEPGNNLPPETLDQWPMCDERAFVYVVGQAMAPLAVEVPWDEPVGVVLSRCLQPDPDARYQSLEELKTKLADAGAKHIPPKAPKRSAAWSYIEPGIGFLGAGDLETALDCFRKASLFDPRSAPARALASYAPPRAFAAPEQRAPAIKPRDVRSAIARARDAVSLGRHHLALEIACDLLAGDPTHVEAREIEARALLGRHEHAAALASANAWTAAAPEDGNAHYLRGKCLLALRRLVEARDAFDRACRLAPKLVVAIWLRGAVDKALKHVRSATGTPVPMPVDLEPGPLRDALVAGRIDEAIGMLETSQLLGDLLSYAGRFEDALRVFGQLEGDAALEGKARALIDLGRTDEAIAVLGTLDADADGFVAIRR